MIKNKFLILFVALIATTALWASNTITYTASEKLTHSSLNVGQTTFGPAITSHTFSNGTGTITCSGEITTIGDFAFYDCSSLTSITIPNSVTTIGNYAFDGCSGLTSVTIPNSVTTIGDFAFFGCISLPVIDNIRYADTYLVEVVGRTLFTYTIKEGTKWIAHRAFSGCTGLTSVTIPNSVTTIGWGAFSDCTGLTSVTIGNSVTTIEDDAFSGCTGLTSVTIGNSVSTIGGSAFRGCSSLTSVTIPNSVTTIGNYAFFGCSGLTSVTIGNSVTTIEDDAFGCTGLTSVTIPNSVTTIGSNAFRGVFNIIYSGTAIGSPWGARCVNGYVDGYLAYSDATKTTLLACSKAATGEITIPSSVTTIGESAFSGCSGLTSVTIPNSVTTIGDWAFSGCSGLTSITIPNSITTIGERAFLYCSGLTSVTIPSSVTTIGDHAFYGCSGLTSITIPNSVTTIGYGAFKDCIGLTSITSEAINPPTCGYDCFYEVDKSIPLYVPAESVEAYRDAEGWQDFTNILPITAEEVEVTEPETEPTNNSVVISWPSVADGETYIIEIRKGEELICTLVFNANGQLMSINFAAPARGGEHGSRYATATATGWTYTITGLEAGTDYTYTIVTKDKDGNVIDTETGSFKTTEIITSVENVDSQKSQIESQKFIRNGVLYIERNGKTYNVSGQKIK